MECHLAYEVARIGYTTFQNVSASGKIYYRIYVWIFTS